jgi:cation:H+ antiporter
MVGISSVTIIESADLAVGDILGSCAFNLGILSLMDVFTPRPKSLLAKASVGHILAASLGMILISLVGLGLFLPEDIHLTPSIGLTSLIFAVVYFLSLRIIYKYNKKHPMVSEHEINPADKFTLKEIIGKYSLYSLVIIGAAVFLPHFAAQISEETGMGKAFVGTLFLAISTSLPEIAVSIAAVRMGSIDMAVGNLLGSNIFNVMILFIDDLFYTRGFLLYM